MTASKIKLTYYTSEGIAEPIRYVLAMSGEQWEDNRLTSEEINDLKPSKNFGPCDRPIRP